MILNSVCLLDALSENAPLYNFKSYSLPKSFKTWTAISKMDTRELIPANVKHKKNKAHRNRPPVILLYSSGILWVDHYNTNCSQ